MAQMTGGNDVCEETTTRANETPKSGGYEATGAINKSMLVIDTPSRCGDCPYCQFQHTDGWYHCWADVRMRRTALKKKERWCPLHDLNDNELYHSGYQAALDNLHPVHVKDGIPMGQRKPNEKLWEQYNRLKGEIATLAGYIERGGCGDLHMKLDADELRLLVGYRDKKLMKIREALENGSGDKGTD